MSSRDVKKAFGLRLKKIRRDKNLTQESVAEKAGLHPTYIGQIERGVRNPSLVNINKIAKALSVPVSKIMAN